MTTAAAIDRLVRHSIIIELNIPSYRSEQAKRKLQAAREEGMSLPLSAATAAGELPCRVGAADCSASPLTEPDVS